MKSTTFTNVSLALLVIMVFLGFFGGKIWNLLYREEVYLTQYIFSCQVKQPDPDPKLVKEFQNCLANQQILAMQRKVLKPCFDPTPPIKTTNLDLPHSITTGYLLGIKIITQENQVPNPVDTHPTFFDCHRVK